MLKKDIKRKLLEVKETKERILTEQIMVRERILSIFESEDNIKNFNNLPKDKKRKLADAFSRELVFLNQNKILSEQTEGGIIGTLKGIFGQAFYGVLETMIEPLIDSLLSALGFGGVFKKFIVSAFTNEKMYLGWGDCRVMTEVVTDGIVEAMVMQAQQSLGGEGKGYSILRNLLVRTFRDQSFYKSMSDSIEDVVCSVFSKISGNVSKVAEKLKPEPSK